MFCHIPHPENEELIKFSQASSHPGPARRNNLCCTVIALGAILALAIKQFPVFLVKSAFSFLNPASMNVG
jgi:hypothetical protein